MIDLLKRFPNSKKNKDNEKETKEEAKPYDFSEFTGDNFLEMCILCGCDYFKWPLTGGFERAYELIGTKPIRGREEVLEGSTDLISHLKKFIKAFAFKYQYVYNQLTKELQHLNVPEVSNLPFLRVPEFGDEFDIRKYEDSTGTYLSTTKAKEIAEGRLNPETHEKFTHVEVEETDDDEIT
ncbi:unnamed protein product [Arabidopsis thaliana]|uniref:Exonuclease 1 n=1 Tax=Arabidopsis thaliana TaxID=3702 RepID=A0A5S9WWN7_ARATH|nr:unnamed protein product [Arabidopsis thaliana]